MTWPYRERQVANMQGGSNETTADASGQQWTRPLRVFLSLVMVLLFTAISGTLITIDYFRGRDTAIADASERMHTFSTQVIDRFQILLGEPLNSINLASVSAAFVIPPRAETEAKIDFLRQMVKFPQVNGAYAGYPDGEFIHVVNLADQGWRLALNPPASATLAVRLIDRGQGGELLSRWIFLDGAEKQLRELRPLPSRYDPRSRPWYRQAITNSGPIATAPYRMATTGAPGLRFRIAPCQSGDSHRRRCSSRHDCAFPVRPAHLSDRKSSYSR